MKLIPETLYSLQEARLISFLELVL